MPRVEDRFTNDFMQMQLEMRSMMQGNKSPDRMPVKIKQQGFIPVNPLDRSMTGPHVQKQFQSSARVVSHESYASPKPQKTTPSFL